MLVKAATAQKGCNGLNAELLFRFSLLCAFVSMSGGAGDIALNEIRPVVRLRQW